MTAAAILMIVATVTESDSLRDWARGQTGEYSLPGQLRGIAQLGLDLTRRDPVTVQDEVIPLSDINPYGMNTFLHNEVEIAKREEILRLLSEAGFYWVREQFPWEDIEIHGRGDFIDRRNDPAGVDAWEKYDNIVSLVEDYGMELIVRLDNPPTWSRSQPDEVAGDFAPPDDFDDFARFAAAVAERYKGRIYYYQIWNEPNIYPEWGEQDISPEKYTDLLCRAYRAIKEVDPTAIVLSGTLAPTSELSGRDFNDFLYLQRMYDAGAGECFDVVTVQGYGLWSGPTDHRMRPVVVNIARNAFIRDIMVQNGDADKPIWISEMNWNAAPEDVTPMFGRVTLDQQAEYAPQAYLRAEQEWPWVGPICFWYFKRPDFSWLDQRRPEAYFQMADPDFNLMPVYDSMKSYIAKPPVIYAGVHAGNHWAIGYDTGWRVDEPYQGTTAASTNDGAEAEFIFSGNALSFDFTGGDIRLKVDGESWLSISPGESGQIAWQGAKGEHTASLLADEGISIISFSVIESSSSLLILVAVILVIAGALSAIFLPPRLPTLLSKEP